MPKTFQADVLGHANGVSTFDAIGVSDADVVMKVIERAGRTCYKSDNKITLESAVPFVRVIIKSGHESVIEHSWFTFHIFQPGFRRDIAADLLLASDLLTVTFREGEGTILVSGNARMFRDFFKSDYFDNDQNHELRHAMLKILREKWPVLFEDLAINMDIDVPRWLILNPHLDYALKEKEKHWWACVRFKGGTRAFTHQFVRHRRKTAFSQESQRYCDEGGFCDNEYFAVPLSVREASHYITPTGEALEDWFLEQLRSIESSYKQLQVYLHDAYQKGLTKGKVNEDARFLLPNAVCSEIVCSAPIFQWKHIFKMRACDVKAQWEIRHVMIKLLAKFQKIFPGVFDDFEINEKDMVAATSFRF